MDNDTAADWAGSFAEAASVAGVAETLTTVADVPLDKSVDPSRAHEAIAAAEVVAAAAGRPDMETVYGEGAILWGVAHEEAGTPELVALAIAAIDRLLGPKSELPEMWVDAETAEEWADDVAELRDRLAGELS